MFKLTMFKTINILFNQNFGIYFIKFVFKIDQDNICDIQKKEVYMQSMSCIKPVKAIDFMRIKALMIKNVHKLSRDYMRVHV